MVQINWQEIIGAVVLLIGGLGSAIAAGKWFLSARQTAITTAQPARMPDTGPPDGAVDWAADLVSAMGQASADSKLVQILAGANRDQAQAARIAELEAAK